MPAKPHIVVLAAGRGERMRSRLPKALHPLLFRPMLHYVLDLAYQLPYRSISVVFSPEQAEVRERSGVYPGLRFLAQERPLGTAHALKSTEAYLRGEQGSLLVLSADTPLLTPGSLRKLLKRHSLEKAAATLGTAVLRGPSGYGRVIRDSDDTVADIREEPDASPVEKLIHEVNAGVYCFDLAELWPALACVGNRNAQGEYYLPDVVRILALSRRKVVPYRFSDPEEVLGVNDRCALWKAEETLRERINKEWMHRGATLEDPRTTSIDRRSELGVDARVEGRCVLVRSRVAAGAHIEACSRVIDSEVREGARVLQGSYVEGSLLGAGCTVGPYARLAPGTVVEPGARVGSFIEIQQGGTPPCCTP